MSSEECPLLALLIAEAFRRGDTLAALADHLGVSYERLAQWRRGAASLRTSRHAVYARAGEYLGVAPVLAMALAGAIGIRDFVWPEPESLDLRIRKELSDLMNDPYVAGFAPRALGSAAPEVKLFVLWLYRELRASRGSEERAQRWLVRLHRAVHPEERLAADADPHEQERRAPGLF